MNKIFFALAALSACSPAFSYPTNATPPTIIGRDNRQNITAKAEPSEKATVVLEIETNDTENDSLCSGAMIGPNIVLTAAHCVSKRRLLAINVIATGMPATEAKQPKKRYVSYGRLPENTPVQKPVQPSKPQSAVSAQQTPPANQGSSTPKQQITEAVTTASKKTARQNKKKKSVGYFPSAWAKTVFLPKKQGKPTPQGNFARDPRVINDYAIIILYSNLGDTTGYYKVAKPENPYSLWNKEIFVLGRGGDKKPRTLWRAKGRILNIDHFVFAHNADMVKGNSGGPIFLAKDPNTIIGLCNHQMTKQNIGLFISQEIINFINQSQKR